MVKKNVKIKKYLSPKCTVIVIFSSSFDSQIPLKFIFNFLVFVFSFFNLDSLSCSFPLLPLYITHSFTLSRNNKLTVNNQKPK